MAKPAFKLDISADQKRHADPDKYVCYVLWIIGHSERTISIVTGLRRKQVAGIIGRSDFKNRAAMTDKERRIHLRDLEEVRFEDGVPLDGGRLNRIKWELIPSQSKQIRGPLKRKMR